ncbi:MAG: hypothetical protein GXO07_04210 [Crenarchaeota archaeon]|nr:hypothetical protein [Thermoproteota archaeon]
MALRLLDVEGLAMTGQIVDVKLVDVCKTKAKLVAKTVDGKEVESVAVDKPIAAKSYFIVLEYIRQWGREIVKDR